MYSYGVEFYIALGARIVNSVRRTWLGLNKEIRKFQPRCKPPFWDVQKFVLIWWWKEMTKIVEFKIEIVLYLKFCKWWLILICIGIVRKYFFQTRFVLYIHKLLHNFHVVAWNFHWFWYALLLSLFLNGISNSAHHWEIKVYIILSPYNSVRGLRS